MWNVKIDFSDINTIIKNHGLEVGGPVQKFFTNEVMRLSDPYVPFRTGVLKNTVTPTLNWDGIIYNTPYARYHWYGKLMVDPITKKGAFYNPKTGRFWSRPNTPKELTEIDMQYNGAPLRGPRWVERSWIDNKENIIKATEAYIKGGAK